MADAAAIASQAGGSVTGFLDKVQGWIELTNLPQQIEKVDVAGLFTNPWFIVPFGLLVFYQLYRQSFRDLMIELIILGIWYSTGTEYMQTLTVNGELQLKKVLPVLFAGAALMGLVIYMLFGRSD